MIGSLTNEKHATQVVTKGGIFDVLITQCMFRLSIVHNHLQLE